MSVSNLRYQKILQVKYSHVYIISSLVDVDEIFTPRPHSHNYISNMPVQWHFTSRYTLFAAVKSMAFLHLKEVNLIRRFNKFTGCHAAFYLLQCQGTQYVQYP